MKEHNFSILLYSDHPKKIQNKYKGLNIGKTSFKKVLSGLSGQKDIDLILRDYEKGYKKYQWLNSRLLIFLKKIKKKYQLFALTNTNDLHFELNTKQGLFKDFKKVYASSKIKCYIGIPKEFQGLKKLSGGKEVKGKFITIEELKKQQ